MIKNEKTFHFLCSSPRSGSTLLSSIINKSKQIQVSANSIVPFIIADLSDLKLKETFKNFPYHFGIDNIAYNVFDLYYAKVNVPNILDQSTWGTPFNLDFLKQKFKTRKFIVLLRPVLECLASFVKVEKPIDVVERCESLMDKHGPIGKHLWSVENLIKEKEECLFIEYKDLVNRPHEIVENIFQFLNLKKEKLDINNITQFTFDGVNYNDDVLGSPLHTIKTNVIEKSNYKIEDYLPKEIIKKYEHIDIRPTWIR